MKKSVSIIVIMLFFSYSYSQSQVTSLIKNSPFHFFDGTFNLSYEKLLMNKKSINLSGGFHLVENGWNDQKQIGWVGELQVRKYLSDNPDLNQLEGFYVSPYFKGGYYRFEDNYGYWYAIYDENNNYIEDLWYPESTYEIKNYQLGLVMGYQFIFSDVISLEFLLGGGIQYADNSRNLSNNTPFDKSYTGVVPKVGFNFGASF
jgi:putative salt-induced outer membrane protein YdiY